MYQLHPNQGVIHNGEHIKPLKSDPKWLEYQAWVKAGNVAAPADIPVTPLAAIHARLISLINQKRNQVEQSGFPYMDHVFDSNQVSAIRINGAAQAAMAATQAGQPFALTWTAADNAQVPMTAADVMGMPLAMAMHSNACHQHGRTMKDAANVLFAAGDRAGLEGFDIDVGWPGQPDPPVVEPMT